MDLTGPQKPLVCETVTLPYGSTALKSVVLWAPDPARYTGYVHWRTSYYFQAEVGEVQGISIDMYIPTLHIYTAQGVINYKGSALITPRDRNIMTARSAIKYAIDFDRGIPVTVAKVVDLIRTHKYQYYEFSPKGSGCLYWQLRLLQAFAEAGWIGLSKPSSILQDIERYQAGVKQKTWKIILPPVEGTGYDPAEFANA